MIYFITKAEAKSLLTPDEHGKYHGPKPGMEFDWYLVFDDPGWTAIDNSSGDAWTEDFKTIEDAIRWLESGESKEDMYDEYEKKEDEPATLANSGNSERDYSADDGETDNLKHDFETAFDQDRLLHLHESDVDLTGLITDFYEKETGQSCVSWGACGEEAERYGVEISEDLPRPDEFQTFGYTEDFWKWMGEIEGKAIESGAETVFEMASFFLGYLMPEAAERRGKKLLEKLANEEPSGDGPHKPTLGELLPLIYGAVEVHTMKPGPLTWSAWFKDSAEAVEALSKYEDGKLLGQEVVTVMAYSANATLTNGSTCLDGDPKTVVSVAG